MKQNVKRFAALMLCIALLCSFPYAQANVGTTAGYSIEGDISGSDFEVRIYTQGVDSFIGRVGLSYDPLKLTIVGSTWNDVITPAKIQPANVSNIITVIPEGNSPSVLFDPTVGRIMFSWLGAGGNIVPADSHIATLHFTLNSGVTASDFNGDTLTTLANLPAGMNGWLSSADITESGSGNTTYSHSESSTTGSVPQSAEINLGIKYTGSDKYRVELHIVDENGDPVDGASVTLTGIKDVDGSSVTETVSTGADGIAIFYAEDGTYDAEVKVTGYDDKNVVNIQVAGAPKVVSNIQLVPTGGGSPGGPSGPSGPGGGSGGGGGSPEEPEEPIDVLYRKAFMNGYGDGTFYPDGNVTRAEIAAIIARIVSGEFTLKDTYLSNYTDINDKAWYVNYVGYVRHLGIMTGDGNGQFRPDDKITREEFAKVAGETAKHLGYIEAIEVGTPNFNDAVNISIWATNYTYTAQKYGWMTGDDNRMLMPKQPLTRAAAAKIICEMEGRVLNAESMKGFDYTDFPDVSSGSWYYFYVIAATNDYAYIKDGAYDQWVVVEGE